MDKTEKRLAARNYVHNCCSWFANSNATPEYNKNLRKDMMDYIAKLVDLDLIDEDEAKVWLDEVDFFYGRRYNK